MVDPHQQSARACSVCHLAVLRRINDCLPRQTRLNLQVIVTYSLIIDYCIIVWGNASSVIRLYRLQKRAARIITDSEYLTPSAPLMRQLRWLPLPQRVQYRQAQLHGVPICERTGPRLHLLYVSSRVGARTFHPGRRCPAGATRASVRGGNCVCLWGALASPVTRWSAQGQSSGTI